MLTMFKCETIMLLPKDTLMVVHLSRTACHRRRLHWLCCKSVLTTYPHLSIPLLLDVPTTICRSTMALSVFRQQLVHSADNHCPHCDISAAGLQRQRVRHLRTSIFLSLKPSQTQWSLTSTSTCLASIFGFGGELSWISSRHFACEGRVSGTCGAGRSTLRTTRL